MLLTRGLSFGDGAGSGRSRPQPASSTARPRATARAGSVPQVHRRFVVLQMPASIKCRCGEVTVTFAEAAPRQSLLCCCVDCVRCHEQSSAQRPWLLGAAGRPGTSPSSLTRCRAAQFQKNEHMCKKANVDIRPHGEGEPLLLSYFVSAAAPSASSWEESVKRRLHRARRWSSRARTSSVSTASGRGPTP